MKEKVVGRVWKFGSNVDTDQIIPADYLITGDYKELAKHAFEKIRPEFAKQIKVGDIIVADENFGCGSSREHAPRALIGCGIACVIARSFARIFYRNSINIGLMLVESSVEANEGEEMEVDYAKGVITNLKTRKQYSFKKPPEFLMKLIEAGGLVEYTKKQLKK